MGVEYYLICYYQIMEIKVQKINTVISFITTLPFVFIPTFIITIVIINCCHDDTRVSNVTTQQNTIAPPITSNITAIEVVPFIPPTIESHPNVLLKKHSTLVIKSSKETKQVISGKKLMNDCEPPFYFDNNGIKVYKSNCLDSKSTLDCTQPTYIDTRGIKRIRSECLTQQESVRPSWVPPVKIHDPGF